MAAQTTAKALSSLPSIIRLRFCPPPPCRHNRLRWFLSTAPSRCRQQRSHRRQSSMTMRSRLGCQIRVQTSKACADPSARRPSWCGVGLPRQHVVLSALRDWQLVRRGKGWTPWWGPERGEQRRPSSCRARDPIPVLAGRMIASRRKRRGCKLSALQAYASALGRTPWCPRA